ncbi:MAG: hypothetical protein VXY77_00765 [Pseudomonadota bacterium]|nr:hypothetical protein [Pseudomonadota bacterium]
MASETLTDSRKDAVLRLMSMAHDVLHNIDRRSFRESFKALTRYWMASELYTIYSRSRLPELLAMFHPSFVLAAPNDAVALGVHRDRLSSSIRPILEDIDGLFEFIHYIVTSLFRNIEATISSVRYYR